MGACDFSIAAMGRNAKEAFGNAVDEARHEYGHRGYTGTIAEKACEGFRLIENPTPRTSTDKVVGWIWDAVDGRANSVPAKYRSWARHHARTCNDKWAPALCIELLPTETAKWKTKTGRKGKRGKVFVFFGLASS